MAVTDKERLNWLIIEDGLRDCHGHFLDFVATFVRGLKALGDKVTVLCARGSSETVLEQTSALPVMPNARWRSGSLRSPINILNNVYWVVASLITLLRHNKLIDQSDVVFLTGTKVQHLIVWKVYSLVRGRRFQSSLLMFFMATPVKRQSSGSEYEWEGVLGHAFKTLVRSLRCGRNGTNIRFVTETEQLTECLGKLSGVSFETMPQAVEQTLQGPSGQSATKTRSRLTIGSFGPPREEKGSHFLINAIAKTLSEPDAKDVDFVVQWTGDFKCADGATATIPPEVAKSEQFRAITHYFLPGEYERVLAETDAVVLPYGDNYNLRGSRVLIDALVRGLPVAVTKGTSMQTLAERYGTCVLIDGFNKASVASAMVKLVDLLRRQGGERSPNTEAARDYFSVKHFRALLKRSYNSEADPNHKSPE